MKKIILLLLFLVFILSCSDDEEKIAIDNIHLSSREVYFQNTSDTILITTEGEEWKTTAFIDYDEKYGAVSSTKEDDKSFTHDWLTFKKVGLTGLQIIVAENSGTPRRLGIEVASGYFRDTISIFQNSINKPDYYSSTIKRLLPSKFICTSNASSEYVTYVFKYDSHNRITNIDRSVFNNKYEDKPESITQISFTYKGNNIIKKTTYSKDNVNVITYKPEGGKIFVDGDINPQDPIDIDNELRPSKFSYDEKGNITVNVKYQFEYDNSTGILKYIDMPYWYLATQMEIFHLGFNSEGSWYSQHIFNNTLNIQQDGHTSYEYTYTYNSDNYPEKMLQKPVNIIGLGVVPENFEIEYIEAN